MSIRSSLSSCGTWEGRDERTFPEEGAERESVMGCDRRWRGLWVDSGLKTSWLERMNAITDVRIYATCAGHRSRGSPGLLYSAPGGADSIVMALAHLGAIARVTPVWHPDKKRQLVDLEMPPRGGGFRPLSKAQWWRRVLWWLELWYGRNGNRGVVCRGKPTARS